MRQFNKTAALSSFILVPSAQQIGRNVIYRDSDYVPLTWNVQREKLLFIFMI